jgi:lia operon protein LiaF
VIRAGEKGELVMNRLFAFVFIGIGVVYLLENVGLVQVDLGRWIADFWPLVFVFFGVKRLYYRVKDEGLSGLTDLTVLWDLFLIALGGVWVAGHLGSTEFTIGRLWDIFWPLLIIGLGLIFLTGRRFKIGDVKYTGDSWDDWGREKTHSGLVGSFHIGDDTEYWELHPLKVRHKIGEVKIDLTRAKIKDGETTIHIDLKVGSVSVILPEGLDCQVTGQLEMGSIRIFGQQADGVRRNLAFKTENYDESTHKVIIHIKAKLGEILVLRAA